jgi:hypothetical protein
MPLAELLESLERSRRDAQLRYVVIHGAACSYCLGRAQRLDGSYLRTFALELKEQLVQTLATFVTSILVEPRGRLDAETAEHLSARSLTCCSRRCVHTMQRSLRFLCSRSMETVAKSEVQRDEIRMRVEANPRRYFKRPPKRTLQL